MASTVQVLCPNGRRQNVKVTPNTKLLQVLEEVCTKQDFLPVNDYDLIHGRKAVDLTLAFRFSNLANNAKLELVKSASPRSQTATAVTIALQLESGERLQHDFPPSASLWEILQHWEKQEAKYKEQLMYIDSTKTPPVHPVCIYMREEVVGQTALQFMTLKKLALTSGKAIIRLVHRPVEDAFLAAVEGKVEEERAREAMLEQLSQSSSSLRGNNPPSTSTIRGDNSQSTSTIPDTVQPTKAEEKMEVDKAKSEKRQETARDDRTGKAPRSPDGLASCVDAPVTGASESGSSPIEQLRNLNIPGVEIFTPSDFNTLTQEEQRLARRLMQQFIPAAISRQQQPAPGPSKPRPLQPSFAGFKFPEETKGKNLYHNELSSVKVEEFKPCEREVVVYDSNEINISKAVVEDPPEDFFDVTDSDVRSLYKELQKQASSLEDRPLMTEHMRDMELEERHQHYEHVMLRVQFPDGLVLQACFRPRETVHALYKFVREHLEDKQQQFHLYRAPPKQVFMDMAKTLVQADLAPATLLHFSSEKTEEHSLSASVRKEISPKRRADELSVKKLARRQMEGLASGSVCGDISPHCSTASSRGVLTSGPRERETSARSRQKSPPPVSSEDAKVPKWLKMGKK